MTKVGLVVRNKFQAYHFHKLAEAYPDATYLLHRQPSVSTALRADKLDHLNRPSIAVHHNTIAEIAAHYDVIFFQTPFPGIERITGPRLVSVQYGLAKERHNYGEWRALADLNLMYGDYSAQAVSHFSPAEAVGNLKFCGWRPAGSIAEQQAAKAKMGFDPLRPMVLYMPTYGKLSSLDELSAPLASLQSDVQIAVKIHHNDALHNVLRVRRAKRSGHQHLFAGNDDQCSLLDAADLVVSDFSGAIFDGIYAGKPVVIYQTEAQKKIGVQKFELDSLEFRLRDKLGYPCSDWDELRRLITRFALAKEPHRPIDEVLRNRLFKDVSGKNAITHATDCVERLLGNDYALTTPQRYVRQSVKKLLHLQRRPLCGFLPSFKKQYAF